MTAKGMVAAVALAITVCVAAGCTTDKESGGENGDSGAVIQAIMEIDGREAAVTLAGSEAAEALVSLLRGGDITFVTDDYGGFEKRERSGTGCPQQTSASPPRPATSCCTAERISPSFTEAIRGRIPASAG